MIYNIGSDTIELVGNEADRFLEDTGIEIYNDEIVIDEAVVDFDEAVSHLAENGIHLYEDSIVLEGEEANKYRDRKDEEENRLYKGFRAEKKYGKKTTVQHNSTIFDSVELIGVNEQIFFKYKRDSQGILHQETKRIAEIANNLDFSDVPSLAKYGISVSKIDYQNDSFILSRKYGLQIHFDYSYKIKSEDMDYEIVEELMDIIFKKAGYKRYNRYSIKKGHGYLFAIDYQDVYIEEQDYETTLNYEYQDTGITTGRTQRHHTPEQRYISIEIKCIEDTPGNMALLRK